MATSSVRVKSVRALIIALAALVTAAVLWTELAGFPHLYGWPLLVIRPEGFDHPYTWIWGVDLIGGCALVAATWIVARRCGLAVSYGFRFRLLTLFGLVTAVAVVAAVWRFSLDKLDEQFLDFSDADESATPAVMFDLTAYLVWLPLWIRALTPLVRLGVLAALGCAVYLVGCQLAKVVGWFGGAIHRRPHRDTEGF